MTRSVTVRLEIDEMQALVALAGRKHRNVQQQAGMLIRTELIRLGLLKEGNEETNDEPN